LHNVRPWAVDKLVTINVGVKVSRGRIASWWKYIGCGILYSASVTL